MRAAPSAGRRRSTRRQLPISTIAPTSSSRSVSLSRRATSCSTWPAATAASALTSSSEVSAIAASTPRPRWSAEASRRLGDRAEAELGDLNDYLPPGPVAATTCFRAIYYARDRRAFFAHVAGYTERKLVFDLNPRQYRLEDVLADLRAAGFAQIDLRPFFSPQRVALPRPLGKSLQLAERSGTSSARTPLSLFVPLFCVAWSESYASGMKPKLTCAPSSRESPRAGLILTGENVGEIETSTRYGTTAGITNVFDSHEWRTPRRT